MMGNGEYNSSMMTAMYSLMGTEEFWNQYVKHTTYEEYVLAVKEIGLIKQKKSRLSRMSRDRLVKWFDNKKDNQLFKEYKERLEKEDQK